MDYFTQDGLPVVCQMVLDEVVQIAARGYPDRELAELRMSNPLLASYLADAYLKKEGEPAFVVCQALSIQAGNLGCSLPYASKATVVLMMTKLQQGGEYHMEKFRDIEGENRQLADYLEKYAVQNKGSLHLPKSILTAVVSYGLLQMQARRDISNLVGE